MYLPNYNSTLQTQLMDLDTHTNDRSIPIFPLRPRPTTILFLTLSIILIIKCVNRNTDLPVQPIPRTLFLHWYERSICSPLQRHTHPSPLFANSLDVIEFDIPLHLQLLRFHKHNAVIGKHDQHVFTGEFEVGNKVFVETFAVVHCLQPELAEGFAL